MSECRTADRNFCTPDGKNAALFVDLDGTVLKCQPYYDEAAENFAYFMQLRGFNAEEVHAVLADVNHKFVSQHGFERDVFPQAIIECYRQLTKQKHRRFSPKQQMIDERILSNIGGGPFFRTPELFKNAAPVLRRARHNFKIFAVTIGNREAQKYKANDAGLSVFEDLIITSRDDKVEHVANVMEDLDISAEYSAFIGNSKRSDGPCLSVTNFIYLPMEGGWSFDNSHDLPQDSAFKLFNARDWREAEEKGINRLVRRRRNAMGSVQANNAGKQGCCDE